MQYELAAGYGEDQGLAAVGASVVQKRSDGRIRVDGIMATERGKDAAHEVVEKMWSWVG